MEFVHQKGRMTSPVMIRLRNYLGGNLPLLTLVALIPLLDLLVPSAFRLSDQMRPIFLFAILGLSLHVITGCTGLLNLGVAAFMAVGAYAMSIVTSPIYPFQLGFWTALLVTAVFSAFVGLLIGLPTLRLRGDYLAIVTLGFGEIVQDSLKNLEVITKGTQGINPIASPSVFGIALTSEMYVGRYYLYLGIFAILIFLISNLEKSRFGRSWRAVREDELAATCLGTNAIKTKLLSFVLCAAIAGISGGLWAADLGSSGEPGNYDFQISVIALCIVIVGGVGNLRGVLLGAIVMVGFNSIVLSKLSAFLAEKGLSSTTNVFSSPNNWKYMVFGLALILTMRFKPNGLFSRR